MERYERFSSVVVQCIKYIGLYILFTIIFGIIAFALSEIFIDLALFRDSSIILFVLFYFACLMLLFFYLGLLFSKKASQKLWKQLIIVLPVVLFGTILWILVYSFTQNYVTQFGDMSWLPYSLYIYWAMPALDALVYYLRQETIIWLGLVAAIIPSLCFTLGIWLKKKIDRVSREKVHLGKVHLGAVALPVILAVVFVLSSIMPKSVMFSLEEYPRVDGATAAIPYGEILMQDLTGVSVFRSQQLVNFKQSHQAYINLILDRADIIFVSGPSEDALRLAEDRGITLKLTPIAKEAFIFLVHKNNPIDNLSVEQIQSIYTGEISNWQELGGADDEIIAYQRNLNSVSQTFMLNHVMQGKKMMEAPMAREIGAMGSLIDTVAEFENARSSIGYSFLFFANEMHRNENVKFLAVDGIASTTENIRQGTYPFTATVYAVTREGEPEDSAASQLLEWILSEEGSKVIEKGGFVPIHDE